MVSQRAALISLLLTEWAGVAAFAPSLANRNVQVQSDHILATRLFATVEKVEASADAPDHMPELRDIAPTIGAKTSNTAFLRYKSDYAFSLANNAQYWNERAQTLLSWEHYPFTPENFEGVVTGGFEHGDVAWFSGAKLNVCYNAIDRHVQNGKANHVAMVSISCILFFTSLWMMIG